MLQPEDLLSQLVLPKEASKMAAKTDLTKGFFLILGALAALWIGGMIIARLPQLWTLQFPGQCQPL